ncbi:MAG: flagellar hook capping FlgD N-terminal domain-containing protein [Limnochordia bacterium]|jgi:flagellar basal-body rod modification protein FlgD
MSSVGRTTSTTQTGWGEQSTPTGNAVLGHDDFLTLLITQLKHQDPIAPMKDQEFAAQMAQFSTLEGIQNLNSQFQRFVELQEWSSQMAQAASLIGRTVDLEADEAVVTGQVSAVRVGDGAVKLVVGGVEYAMGALKEVRA